MMIVLLCWFIKTIYSMKFVQYYVPTGGRSTLPQCSLLSTVRIPSLARGEPQEAQPLKPQPKV